ncbi:MAG: zf-HC2 domain-containing protein [Candidatus Polarisedimenticolia bacterium]
MTADAAHPHLLAWHVAGHLDPETSLGIEAHLTECPACRQEAEALSSMAKSLILQSCKDHVPAERLVQYEDEESAVSTEERAALGSHLEGCAACRQDLQALRSARVDSLEVSPRRRWPMWAAAAAAVAGLAVSPWLLAPRGRPAPVGASPGGTVLFAAPVRGAHVHPVLKGSGPWPARVLLPLDVDEGDLDVTLRRGDGSLVAGFGRLARVDRERSFFIDLPVLEAPGAYVMVIRLRAESEAEPLLYDFEVLRPGDP